MRLVKNYKKLTIIKLHWDESNKITFDSVLAYRLIIKYTPYKEWFVNSSKKQLGHLGESI